MKTKAASAGY